jgi:hypothetical protein
MCFVLIFADRPLQISPRKTMAISSLVQSLTAKLSPTSTVLTDPASTEFKAALERWTELDLKTPGAIVVVSSEEDIIQTVSFSDTAFR